MSLVPSLAPGDRPNVDGEALVMHAGDKPYVVSPTGQVDLASRGLTLEAVNGIVAQLLPAELQHALDEFGAVQYELPRRCLSFPASISRSSRRAAATTSGPKSAAGGPARTIASPRTCFRRAVRQPGPPPSPGERTPSPRPRSLSPGHRSLLPRHRSWRSPWSRYQRSRQPSRRRRSSRLPSCRTLCRR